MFGKCFIGSTEAAKGDHRMVISSPLFQWHQQRWVSGSLGIRSCTPQSFQLRERGYSQIGDPGAGGARVLRKSRIGWGSDREDSLPLSKFLFFFEL